MDKPNTVYVTFIGSTPDRVWSLLTDADSSPQWFIGNRMDVGAAVGEPYRLYRPDGTIEVDGKELAIEPGRLLRVSWAMPELPASRLENEVDFLIEDKGDGVVRLAVQEFHHEPIPEKWIESGREGWSLILASVKTLLETGKPLPGIRMEPPE